jgi:ABC-2 type transport system permease protein
MSHALGLYRRLIAANLRSQMSYRASFWLESLASFSATITAFLTLALILERFNNIAGWTLWEVAFLYGMVETAFGVMDMLFSGFDPQNFGVQVRLGRFDQLLLRPASITLQVLGSEFVLRRLGRIAQGLVVLGLVFSKLNIHWTLAKLAYLPVVFASLVAFYGGLFVIGATITFWTVESIEAINIFTYGGSELMAYPMQIYQDWMRLFFTYVVPAIFLNYYPALYFLDKPDPFHLPVWAHFLAPLAGFGVLGAGMLFWRYGLRHYQSTGS